MSTGEVGTHQNLVSSTRAGEDSDADSDVTITALTVTTKSKRPLFLDRFNAAGTSRLEQMPTATVEDIVRYVVGTEVFILPFFKQGMLRKGIFSAPLNDEDVICGENLDLSILRLNKAFHELGTNIFYSENNFVFEAPAPCK